VANSVYQTLSESAEDYRGYDKNILAYSFYWTSQQSLVERALAVVKVSLQGNGVFPKKTIGAIKIKSSTND